MGEVRGFKNIDVTRRDRPFGEILKMTREERRELAINRGVQVTAVLEDTDTPFTPVYDPTHPHANEEGYVLMPNVDVAEEQMDFLAASQSFLNNLAVYDMMTTIAQRTLSMSGR
jgi:flagellar basal-body rod protein FlgC